MVNTTFFDTSNNIVDLFQGVITNLPSFPYFILGALALIIFLVNINEDTKKVIMLEGYVIGIITAVFVALRWLDISMMFLSVLAFIFGVFATLFIKKDY